MPNTSNPMSPEQKSAYEKELFADGFREGAAGVIKNEMISEGITTRGAGSGLSGNGFGARITVPEAQVTQEQEQQGQGGSFAKDFKMNVANQLAPKNRNSQLRGNS